MYALNLNGQGRILSICHALPATPRSMPRTEQLPEGRCTDYRWNGGYIYDPLPPEEEPEAQPSAQADLMSMMVDHEYRLTLLELGLATI